MKQSNYEMGLRHSAGIKLKQEKDSVDLILTENILLVMFQ